MTFNAELKNSVGQDRWHRKDTPGEIGGHSHAYKINLETFHFVTVFYKSA